MSEHVVAFLLGVLIGGAVWAALGAFEHLWIKRRARLWWEEEGKRIMGGKEPRT